MSKNIVVTHSRRFHIDELMAVTLLNKFLLKDDYELIRTRDEKIIKEHQKNESSFVIDVGFLYQEDKLNFDHHQKGCDLKWSNGVPFSSCGMIWSFLKKNNLLQSELSLDEINHIEENMIIKIDAHDNGIEIAKEFDFVLAFNRTNASDDMLDKQFKNALYLLSDYFENTLFTLRNNITQNNISHFHMSIALLNIFKLKNNNLNSLNDFFNYTKNMKIDRSWNENEKFGVLGQVWYDLCQDERASLSRKINNELKKELEEKLIKPMDLFKSEDLNYLKIYERSDGSLDQKAVQACAYLFFNFLSSIKSKIEHFKLLKKDIEDSKELKGFFVLKSKCATSKTDILDLCDKDLFILPHSKGKWIIQTVPLNKMDLFSKKSPMPKEWRGLSGQQLEKASGVKGLDFCHKNGFMCVLNGNLDSAKAVANIILKHNNYDFSKENKIFKIKTKSNKNNNMVNDNEILDIKECIKNSEGFDNVIVLDKNYSDKALKEVLKTNKKFFIKKKGEVRWFIGTVDKSKFVDPYWKSLEYQRLHEKLHEVSNIKELATCDKKLNLIIVKCNQERAIEIVKEFR